MMQAVIFDFDGLLVDTEVISFQIYKELLNELGFDFSMEEYAQNYSGKPEKVNITNFIEKYQLSWTLDDGIHKVSIVEQKLLAQGVDLKPGAVELLKYLKNHNYKMAIASSSTKDRALYILNQHKIASYFDAFVFAQDVKRGKPNPDVFLKACEKLAVLPADALVLEDSESGIQAAYSAQIPVICIPDMKKPAQNYIDMTERVYHSLSEVIPYLEKV